MAKKQSKQDPAAVKFKVLKEVIGFVDIETLALRRDKRSVVYDVGMLVTNIVPEPGYVWNQEDAKRIDLKIALGDPLVMHHGIVFEQLHWSPSILEQILCDRVIDPDTLLWHRARFAKMGGQLRRLPKRIAKPWWDTDCSCPLRHDGNCAEVWDQGYVGESPTI